MKENEMNRTCGTYGRDERCMYGFGGDTWGNEPLVRPRCRWQHNIKMYL